MLLCCLQDVDVFVLNKIMYTMVSTLMIKCCFSTQWLNVLSAKSNVMCQISFSG